MKVKIGIAQTLVRTGDLEGNTNRILADIEKAIKNNIDIVLFSELCISGYCAGSLFLNNGFITHQLEFLEKKIVPFTEDKKICVIIGFVDRNGKRLDGNPDIYNSCAVIQNGKIVGTYSKIHLADIGHHEDSHYFSKGENPKVFDIIVNSKDLRIGCAICEDFWAPKDHFRNVVKETVDMGAKIMFSPNQSYFYYGKKNIRKKVFGEHAKKEGVPVFFCNGVGLGDSSKNLFAHSGSSTGFDKLGNVILECESFKEDFKIVEIDTNDGLSTSPVVQKEEEYSLCEISNEEKYQEIFDAICFAQKEVFAVIGIDNALVSLSGGIDSAVTGAIVALSMPKENVIFISSPTEDNGEKTKNNAQYTADIFGIKLHWISMQEAYKGYIDSFKQSFSHNPKSSAMGAYAAVGRTALAIGACHEFGSAGIVSTNNFSENVLGFSSFHDIGNAGTYAPIGDLTKPEIYELAKFINKKFGKKYIPENLYNGEVQPSAELNDNKKADPFDYYCVSGICSMIVRKHKSIYEIVDSFENRSLDKDDFPIYPDGKNIYESVSSEDFKKEVYRCFELSKRSVFKCAQASPNLILHPISRGFSARETILNKYCGEYEINTPKRPIQFEVKKLHLKKHD